MSTAGRVLSVNGVRLHHEEHGEGAPILCIHGSGSSALVWRQAVERLCRLGRVIAYDRRGCSRSERPVPYHRTSIGTHADDAAALLRELNATPAIVIGRSYGGEVAVDLALRHAGAVRALVVLEGAPVALDSAAAEWEHALERRVIEAAERDGMDSVGETLVCEVVGEAAWRAMPPPLRETITGNGPAIVAELRGGGLRTDASALAALDVPVLLVAAEASPPAFRRATEAMARAVPGARVETVGGGHLVDPAHPAVLGFVAEVLETA